MIGFKKGKEVIARIVGVVASGPRTGCGTSSKPNIFTRVSSFLPWIKKHKKSCKFTDMKKIPG